MPAGISEVSIGAPTAVPERLDTGCREDLLTVDGQPLPVRIEAATADLLAGDAVDATPCTPGELTLAAGRHRLATTAGAATGLHVDRIVLADPAAGPPAETPATEPTVTIEASGRTGRDVIVEGCPDGCWLVLGEGFNDAWSASTADGDLGPPQLVDGGFNGWRIAPSDGPVDVAIRWTAQTPLTVALVLSVVAGLSCIALAALDRRRTVRATVPPARFAVGEGPVPMRVRWVAAGVWVVLAAMLVGPGWALAAAVAAAALVVALGRPRLAGFVTMGILAVMGAVVVSIVRTERTLPDAGWPVRFERLHGLGLFAAVTLGVTLAAGWPPRALARRRDREP